jgi:DNA-binding response OmpR family regulator
MSSAKIVLKNQGDCDMKILLLEDDELIAEQIIDYFQSKHHEITHFLDGESLLDSSKILETDVCIFDINVPKLSGLETLKLLRELHINKPTLFLTALSDINHIKTAYTLGCEDYIRKPFHFEELELRIHKLINHCMCTLRLSSLFSFDFTQMRLCMGEREVPLSDIEKRVLYLLAKNRDHFIPTHRLKEYVWEEENVCDNTLRTTIKRLRSKIGDEMIESSRTLGYKLVTRD